MREKLFLLILIILFIPLTCLADLTKEQGEAIASFAENLINAQTKSPHVDSKGFPLIAYNLGADERIAGYNEQLIFFAKDFKNINAIGGNKWAFDCSSWTAYLYHHVFGLSLTINDSARPYTVSSFVEDGVLGKNFHIVSRNIKVSSLNINTLQKGDLLAIEGVHIMMYIGDGKIAHVSSTSIVKDGSLGAEVILLKNKFPYDSVTIIRPNVINNPANVYLTWPDTKKREYLGVVDNLPTITVNYNTKVLKSLKLNITFVDDKGLKGYQVSKEKNIPNNWLSFTKLYEETIEYEITSSGTYYIFAKDSRGQVATKELEITNVDITPPVINNIYYYYDDKTGLFNVTIDAMDDHKLYYSVDGINYQAVNQIFDLKSQNYTLYVKDEADNLITKELNLDKSLFPKINISYDQSPTSEVELEIEINGTNILYQITKNQTKDIEYLLYDGIISYSITENGTYYLWVKNEFLEFNEEIEITNIDNIPPIINDIKISKTLLGYQAIIDAKDDGCGILGYSKDNIEYQESNELKDLKDEEIIYVKDKCGNMISQKITSSSNKILYIAITLFFIIIVVLIYLLFFKRSRFNSIT